MSTAATTIDFPEALPLRREAKAWFVDVDGIDVKVSNPDKPYWGPEGYTKADLLAYWYNAGPWVLPYLRDRPLTLKRMPDGADGAFFYAKQAPPGTPPWMLTAPVTGRRSGKTTEYLLASNRASLVFTANLGCIELHPWHSRVDDIGRPDYAFFDLDPMGAATFDDVRDVALLVRTALENLGLRGYPRTSGATGMQVYVPVDRRHSAGQIREWVGRVCRLLNRADPQRTTMEWVVQRRGAQVFLDHNMNTEGKNIAATYSPRPERSAPVATPLRWEEIAAGIEPADFTMATIFQRLTEVGDLFAPVLAGGQDLSTAMGALGMDPTPEPDPAAHEVAAPTPAAERLATYRAKRDFARTPEPPPPAESQGNPDDAPDEDERPRFVLQHHLARRLHHDLRLERHGTAPSWALPKGLPDRKGVRHLAVQTEDHPVSYMSFSGEIPAGEYGGGQVRIWDAGGYDLLEWTDDKVTFRLHGRRHSGEYHLFRTGRDGDTKQWLVIRADDALTDVPPDPPSLSPMLASDGGRAFDDPDWLFEIKWDGVRAIATVRRPGAGDAAGTRLVSRQGNDITPAYPELAPLWERVLARNAVLDGEIVALDGAGRPSFQRLQRRMHLRDTVGVARAAERSPVRYMVFDLLAADGQALTGRPLRDRLALLDEILVPGGPFVRSVAVPSDGKALFAAARQQGLEGLIAKRSASLYRPGKRTRDWLKFKVRRRAQVVIGGWLPGKEGRSGRLGALLLGLYDGAVLQFVGRAGTGFDDAELTRLEGLLADLARDDSPFGPSAEIPRQARYVDPILVCSVEYVERTEVGLLRHPSYKGLVADAAAGQCTLRELES
ncbi:MAG: non-homologous end-joining DNA ligase [Actinomycetota bacterium]|jgi:bifunctional non-homologous end joining protein LigD|nr:non-homologous end-joining DNA ligase [Actinomycetota bacterium]